MPTKRKTKARKSSNVVLAWMGWSCRLPPDWRPLRIEGKWRRGAIVLGDADRALLQLKWWRPAMRRFDAREWIAMRVRGQAHLSAAALAGTRAGTAAPGRADNVVVPTAPQPRGFAHVAWIPKCTFGEGARGLWYGYAPEADLMLEAVVNAVAPKRDRDVIARSVLPSLRAAGPRDEVRLAVFGASFTAGAGFRLVSWQLRLGDIAVRLASSEGAFLTLRQVYPAELALSRRSLVRWQEVDPFPGRRRYRPGAVGTTTLSARPGGEPEPCSLNVSGRNLLGTRRRGVKSFPFPLGRLRPLESVSVAVHDREGGRLLLAEYDARGEAPEETATRAIAGMNWAESLYGGKTGRRQSGEAKSATGRGRSPACAAEAATTEAIPDQEESA